MNCYITIIETYCGKDGCYKRQACILGVEEQYHHGDVFSEWLDLAYML